MRRDGMRRDGIKEVEGGSEGDSSQSAEVRHI